VILKIFSVKTLYYYYFNKMISRQKTYALNFGDVLSRGIDSIPLLQFFLILRVINVTINNFVLVFKEFVSPLDCTPALQKLVSREWYFWKRELTESAVQKMLSFNILYHYIVHSIVQWKHIWVFWRWYLSHTLSYLLVIL
jgi:hypothetical protein